MAPWWHNVIRLWEISDANASWTHNKPPGIHYAVKRARDKSSLLDDLGAVLERGMRGERAPAGLAIGSLRSESVQSGFTRKEIDELYANGYNPIIIKQGIPYVWGQHFYNNDGQLYRIADFSGLTPEFRQFIAKPLIQSFYDLHEAVKLNEVPEPAIVALTPEQTIIHRAINAHNKAFGLVTLEIREVV